MSGNDLLSSVRHVFSPTSSNVTHVSNVCSTECDGIKLQAVLYNVAYQEDIFEADT